MTLKTRLAALLLCALPHLAFAQMVYGPATITSGTISSTVRVTPNGQAETSLGAALAAVGGCPLSGCTFTGAVNTNSANGYQQNGQTLVNSFGNSGNQFGDGPGTVTLVGLGAGVNLDPSDYLTTAVGWHALNASTQTNSESTAIGWHAQALITTGGFNTSVGVNGIGSCLICVHDMAFGTDAIRNSLTASFDTAIGVSALINDGSAGSNIAIGDNAFPGNTGGTGQFNIAIGNSSLASSSLTTANEDILIGTSAGGAAITSASADVGIGHLALQSLTTGNNVTAVGFSAGNKATTGNLNTFIGSQAGFGVTTGSQITVVGAVPNGAINELTTAIGAIAIGYNAVPVNATQNNSINIGNTYYGNATAPIVGSGFGTSPSVVTSAGSAAFTVNVGTGGSASSGVITLAVQPHGYLCKATDTTNAATFVEEVVPNSATQITISNYSRTTGTLIAWTASDVIAVSCSGY